jgi:hypothetical protein
VFNADDPQADIWRELSRERRQVSFGLDRPADVHGSFVARGLGGALQLETPWGALELALGVPGATMRAMPAPPRRRRWPRAPRRRP